MKEKLTVQLWEVTPSLTLPSLEGSKVLKKNKKNKHLGYPYITFFFRESTYFTKRFCGETAFDPKAYPCNVLEMAIKIHTLLSPLCEYKESKVW